MAVFAECHRVLKEDGLLVFSYHHSRPDGWSSLAAAVFGAGFTVAEAHPVRAEMSVATPKAQASEPIQLDVLLVCRKRANDSRPAQIPKNAWLEADRIARERCARLEAAGFKLSRNDRQVVRNAHFLVSSGPVVHTGAREWNDAFSAAEGPSDMSAAPAVSPAVPDHSPRRHENLELFA